MEFKSWLIFRQLHPLYIGHFIRRMHFWKTLESIPLNRQIKTVLDIGCGSGVYAYEMASRFATATVKGIDLDIASLKSKWPALPNLKFEVGDATKLVDKDYYNFIYCIDVIDDIRNWELALQNIKEALKEQGFLYIHFPKHPRIVHVFKMKQVIEYWKRDASYSHAKCSDDELKSNLEKLGFDIIYEYTTFGRVAVFAQEVSLLMLMRRGQFSRVLHYVIHPLLIALALSDLFLSIKFGNGLAILCQKR